MSTMEILPSSSSASSAGEPDCHDATAADNSCAPADAPAPSAPCSQDNAPNDQNASDDQSKAPADDGVREANSAKCAELKAEGNALYGQGDVAGALAKYRDALLYAAIRPPPNPEDIPAPPPLEPTVGTATDSAATAAAAAADSRKDAGVQSTGAAVPPESDPDTPRTKAAYVLTSQVYCNAGLCLKKLGETDEAIDFLSEALRHHPDYDKALLRRADCYYDKEKWSSCYADFEAYEKLGGKLSDADKRRRDYAKSKVDEEMKKMLSDLKDLGNRFLSNFGLSTDNFKFDKDPNTGGYSMRFEK